MWHRYSYYHQLFHMNCLQLTQTPGCWWIQRKAMHLKISSMPVLPARSRSTMATFCWRIFIWQQNGWWLDKLGHCSTTVPLKELPWSEARAEWGHTWAPYTGYTMLKHAKSARFPITLRPMGDTFSKILQAALCNAERSSERQKKMGASQLQQTHEGCRVKYMGFGL